VLSKVEQLKAEDVDQTFPKFAPPTASELGAYAAAQLLVSLNFHYVMRAMPALPLDDYQRHTLNAALIALALKK
jgi:hypothetical protein